MSRFFFIFLVFILIAPTVSAESYVATRQELWFSDSSYYKTSHHIKIGKSINMDNYKVFGEFGFFDEMLPACEDYDFWLRFCAYEEVHFLNEPLLIKNGGHDQQLSKKHWGMDRFRILALEKLLQDPRLDGFKRQETIKELIRRLEILIEGGRKRKKNMFVRKLAEKKAVLEASLFIEKESVQCE